MSSPRSPTHPTFGRIPMSSSVPSRLQFAAQPTAVGSPDRRTPTPGGGAQAQAQAGSNRRNSQLRSSIVDASASRMALGSALGVSSGSLGQTQGSSTPAHTESSTVMLEWPIPGWEMLGKTAQARDNGDGVDESEEDEPDRPDIMRRGIIFGEGVYKVDIDSGQDPFDSTPDSPIALSIFLSCLTVETAPLEYSFTTSLFAGIRPAHVDVGQSYAETRWSWHCNTTHEFSRETDYARIALPDYQSVLLPQAPGEWVLVLRISYTAPSPVYATTTALLERELGSVGWAQPGEVTVPRDVMAGLEQLLDSPSGDVQFVCLEHARAPTGGSDDGGEGVEKLVSRKRVIYAHSEILKARSTYFKMLLDGGFKETEGQTRRTITVDDAGYDTVYWLLRFIYCNALTFASSDDVRLITDISSLDRRAIHKVLGSKSQSQSASKSRHHWTPPQSQEWEYRQIPLDTGSDSGETMSATMSMSMTLSEPDGQSLSEASVYSGPGRMMSPTKGEVGRRPSLGSTLEPGLSRSGVAPSVASNQASAAASNIPPIPARRGAPPSSMAATISSPSKSPATTTASASNRLGRPPVSGPSGKAAETLSPRLPKHPLPPPPHRPLRLSDVTPAPTPDPHPHTAPPPTPPSALSMYMLSHRYDIPVLQALAKKRVLKGLSADDCMPMLLATHAYDTLHAEVLDYVIDYFGTIQGTPGFKAAVKEVSSGQWGSTGGEVLLGMFQRL